MLLGRWLHPVNALKVSEGHPGRDARGAPGDKRGAGGGGGSGSAWGRGGGLADAGRPFPGLSFPVRVPAVALAGQRLLGRRWLGAPPPAGGPAPSRAFWKVQGRPPPAQPVALETVSLWRRRRVGWACRKEPSARAPPALPHVRPAASRPAASPGVLGSGAPGRAGSGSVALAETAAFRTSSRWLPVPFVDTPTSHPLSLL